MMNQAQMESEILQQRLQIQQLQEQIAALMPRVGTVHMLDEPIMDMEHAGRLSDYFEHGTKAISEHSQPILCHKAQASYHMDPSGRIGQDWKHVVKASNNKTLAVDGWVP